MIGCNDGGGNRAVGDLARAEGVYGETPGPAFLWEKPASVRFRCGESSELSIFKRPPTAMEPHSPTSK